MKPEINKSVLLFATTNHVWRAITDAAMMRNWYFDLPEFVPEVGFKFEFLGGDVNDKQYNHLCEVLEAVPDQLLSYSWRYEGYEGDSIITFRLTIEENATRLDFSHSGLTSFPSSNPAFAVHNFEEGWRHFIDNALPQFLITTSSNE